MGKFISGKIAIGVFLLVFFGTSMISPGLIENAKIIKQRMVSLGFLESKIVTQTDGSYSIKVNAYVQKSQALSLDSIFRPFEGRAKYSHEVLYLEKSDIERAGFSVHEEYLPRGVKIVRMGIITRSVRSRKTLVDPNIQKIERALKDTNQNRKGVLANSKAVVQKANSSFVLAFPDVCKTPSKPGPIHIPYPNISRSSDTARDSKKSMADKAAAIAKDSDFMMSESDEVAVRMTKLQKSFQKIIAKRELRTNEKAEFKKELKICLDKAELLEKTLEVYVEEIEKLLQQAKK